MSAVPEGMSETLAKIAETEAQKADSALDSLRKSTAPVAWKDLVACLDSLTDEIAATIGSLRARLDAVEARDEDGD